MNKEQFIDTLQACYFGDKGAFNKILKEYEELHNKIDKVVKLIEYNYYSKNTTDIDSIVISNNKLIQIRKILKESDINE